MRSESEIPPDGDPTRPDHETVARLLGREPAGAFSVVVRRPDGSPAVIENAPLLYDGTPMPTRFWVVDTALRESVSRLEAGGGVRQAGAAVPSQAVEEAHALYAAERDQALPPGHAGPAPSGGVGGTRRGVKCLHAHLAWYLAGGSDPIGRWTAERLGLQRSDFFLEEGVLPVSGGSVAAVDCGSNSTRLLIVDSDGAALERRMRITRLGEGVDITHRLSQRAIDRTVAVLDEYGLLLGRHVVRRVRVVATSAARDADNAEVFQSAVENLLGVRPEILEGEEEARLSFVGATAHLPAGLQGQLLVVDIGGGSTEMATGWYGATHELAAPVATTSLDIGCVRISERFLRHDPPTDDELAAARAFASELVARARDDIRFEAAGTVLVGLAGTVSTLACLEFGILEYDRARIHHSVLTRAAVERWLDVLSSEVSRSRLEHPGMVQGREDVIVGGALILSVVMETFGCDACLVSEDDILDGLVANLLGLNSVGGSPDGG